MSSHQQTASEREAPSTPQAPGDPGESAPTTKRRGQKRSLATTTLRTAVACLACRERKTRCSGHQPTCTYCSKTGARCEYLSETITPAAPAIAPSSLDEWGHRILSAVDDLARGLRIPQQLDSDANVAHGLRNFNEDAGINYQQNQDFSVASPVYDQGCRKRRRISGAAHLENHDLPIPGASPVDGLSSVLQWNSFSGPNEPPGGLRSFLHAAKSRVSSHQSGLESASCAASDLLALTATFGDYYLPAMPVLNMTEVRRLVGEIGEFGVAWSTESCLILLIASLASMCRQDGSSARAPWGTPHLSSPASSLLSGSASSERRTPSALRYWNMARKRLVWATSDSGLLAAQCQFLAGVWHLLSSEPVPAWKMLSGALLSVDDGADDDPSHHLLQKNIRTTCLILLCRLRCEINISFSQNIYNRPLQSGQDAVIRDDRMQINPPATGELPEFDSADDELLRIRQRACANHSLLHEDMSIIEVCAFHEKMSTSHLALQQWHTALPSHLFFPIYPDHGSQANQTSLGAEQDGRRRLQYSYYETEEIILRPSLFMLLNVRCLQSTSAVLPDSSVEQVAPQLRAMSLRHRVSMLVRVRLCLDPQFGQPHLLEIGWLRRQTCVTLALMLIASERASRLGSVPPRMDADEISLVSVIDMIEEFLSHDKLCGDVSKRYLDLLRKIRGQPGLQL